MRFCASEQMLRFGMILHTDPFLHRGMLLEGVILHTEAYAFAKNLIFMRAWFPMPELILPTRSVLFEGVMLHTEA